MRPTILIVDGLPPSSKANGLRDALSLTHDTHYLSFAKIAGLSSNKISRTLDETMQTICQSCESLAIVGVSFGAYVLAHSNDILVKYKNSIKGIYLYSPVARINEVIGIGTLPDYLNKKYPNLKITLQDLRGLDAYFSKHNLLHGELAKKTKIILGKNDSQLPLDVSIKYYADYEMKVINTGHISISTLLSKGVALWEWM